MVGDDEVAGVLPQVGHGQQKASAGREMARDRLEKGDRIGNVLQHMRQGNDVETASVGGIGRRCRRLRHPAGPAPSPSTGRPAPRPTVSSAGAGCGRFSAGCHWSSRNRAAAPPRPVRPVSRKLRSRIRERGPLPFAESKIVGSAPEALMIDVVVGVDRAQPSPATPASTVFCTVRQCEHSEYSAVPDHGLDIGRHQPKRRSLLDERLDASRDRRYGRRSRRPMSAVNERPGPRSPRSRRRPGSCTGSPAGSGFARPAARSSGNRPSCVRGRGPPAGDGSAPDSGSPS